MYMYMSVLFECIYMYIYLVFPSMVVLYWIEIFPLLLAQVLLCPCFL